MESLTLTELKARAYGLIAHREGNPTGETNPERPAGTIEEITFLENIPANAFPDATLWGRIERLVSMRIDRLDLAGKFN